MAALKTPLVCTVKKTRQKEAIKILKNHLHIRGTKA